MPVEAGESWQHRPFRYCRSHRRTLVLGFLRSVGAAITASLVSLIIREVIDRAIVARSALLVLWLTLLPPWRIGEIVTGYVRRYYAGRLSF